MRQFKSILKGSKLYICSLWVAKLLIISDIVKLIHLFFHFLNDILMKTRLQVSLSAIKSPNLYRLNSILKVVPMPISDSFT